MRNILTLILLVAASCEAMSKDDEKCPILPAQSEVHFELFVGPDFYVCYAMNDGNQEQRFGVYLGFHPNFTPEINKLSEPGYVGGRKVDWYYSEQNDPPSIVGRETSLEIEDGWMAHVWFTAKTDTEMNNTLKIIQNMEFR